MKPIALPARPKASARYRAKAHAPARPLAVKAFAGGAEIMLYGEIGRDGITAEMFAQAIHDAPAGDLVIRINSEGGDIFDGIAMYNDLRASGRNITARITSIAGSAASVVAMAGKRIEIAATAHFMIHRSWCEACGNEAELREVADVLASIDENSLMPVYAERTGLPVAEIRQLMSFDNYIPGPKAVEMRFCDGLVGDERPGLSPQGLRAAAPQPFRVASHSSRASEARAAAEAARRIRSLTRALRA